MTSVRAFYAPGSSPRVRGKQRRIARPSDARRLIPACAGKTGPGLEAAGPGWAHPRVCGENRSALCDPAAGWGSSPRVRGKRDASFLLPAAKGLIPACAGKTRNSIQPNPQHRAHPRVCGENVSVVKARLSSVGSSPRVRGKLPWPPRVPSLRRLIPACAGKTEGLLRSDTSTRAHPRVCGENCQQRSPKRAARGSSPRVRGKRGHLCCAHGVQGLIPACAGKTCGDRAEANLAEAHPRVCGENFMAVDAGGLGEGSSPRVRGKPYRENAERSTYGLIPACAGKT